MHNLFYGDVKYSLLGLNVSWMYKYTCR